MKIRQLIENDSLSLIKMMTQGIRNVPLDIKEVDVHHEPHKESRKKECYNNAFKALASYPNAKFVLGYLVFHGIPIEHAWIKDGNTYFDVTLDPKKQEKYFSVAEFSVDEISEYVEKHHTAPSLFDLNRFLHKK